MRARRRIASVLAGLVGAALLGGCGIPDPGGGPAISTTPRVAPLVSTNDLPVTRADEVHLFGFNDLHGNLSPPGGSTGQIAGHDAGGAAYLATHLARLKTAYHASAVVAAGDNIGASPLVSALFHDEPTITLLNNIGVAASSVGNHEFDDGMLELTRVQQGGCAMEGCSPGTPFTGARFPYLAANVVDAQGNAPPRLRPWVLLEVGQHKIGIVGTVTTDTANIVLPTGIRGYLFSDEAAAVNRYVPDLKAAVAEAIVALVHDGGAQRPEQGTPLDYNGCADITSNVTELVDRLDPAVRAVITGHSHQPYVCTIGGKAVTQAASYGRLITDISLRFGADGVRAFAVNRVVTREVTPDATTTALIDFFTEQSRPRAGRVVGASADALPREPRPAGTSSLGDLIADAMLSTTASPSAAVASFMNPGGVRADLRAGPITYGDLFTVQPFGNQLVTLTLTGTQILRLLEQQWADASNPTLLSPAGLTYIYSRTAPAGSKVIADSVRVAGQPLDPFARYRITTNNFLASGGDGFTVFTDGAGTTVGPIDLDAFEAFLRDKPTLHAPSTRVEHR
ncbi:5'-nucleotidase C-terminal domain-containing protein [Nocardia sp. NPDC049190]|uniref:bifunctional metallophosphatase/5'-nucleotidase n=1 Tax=Nocardia sp. NPDC049190 TaxID=3155650 RepID=UPI0033D7EAB7